MSIIVTSDYSNLSDGPIRGRLGRRTAAARRAGTEERGRARMSVEIEAEPLVHNFDELELGRPVAEALAGAMRAKIKGTPLTVSESTLYTRTRQEKAYREGRPWAVKRFGFRGAPRPPSSSTAMFNQSGTTADSVVATPNRTDRSWTVNVAGNRLDPRTSGGTGEFAFITSALNRVLGDVRQLMRHPTVEAAKRESLGAMITTARKLGDRLAVQRLTGALDLVGLGGISGKVRTLLL